MRAHVPRRDRAVLFDAVAIAVGYAALCVAARLAGFDHVSDDDFSRVTIAQGFAHAPKLDPSGTSWLPFPFWALGGAMLVFGRSLAGARVISLLLAAAAAALPYVAMRLAGVPRARAIGAMAFALGTPWFVWSGATTVPESFTASLSTAAVLGGASVVSRDPTEVGAAQRARRGLLIALAMMAATLSRYETWPVAAALAVWLAAFAVRGHRALRRPLAVMAVLCALGPLAWMAWNAHAHDGPLHFFRRVSTFKQGLGEAEVGVRGALLLYPRLLVTTRPEVVIPALFVLVPALRDGTLRRRWALPLASVAAQIAFLAYGNVGGGAPAHHSERALLGSLLVLALFVVDAGLVKLRELTASLVAAPRVTAACVAVAWVISSVRGYEPPGRGPTEDRRAQISRGDALRAAGASALDVTPCAYEHFALIAAFGAPERVTIATDRATQGDECPAVVVGLR